MKKFLKALNECGIKYRLSMTGDFSGIVYRLSSGEVWFTFNSVSHGLQRLKEVYQG